MSMTVKQLREALRGVPDDVLVVVPNNEFGGYDQVDEVVFCNGEFRIGSNWEVSRC